MNTRAELVMGQVAFRDKPTILPLVCLTRGVTAQQATRKWSHFTIEERMYRYSNGMALCARRGGPLHLGDRKSGTWEMFILNELGFANGDAVGFIAEDHLARLVAHLAKLVAAS